jgi:acyl carrier protein
LDELQLKELFSRVFAIPADQVGDNLERGKLEVWDSLNHLLLITEIEKEMNVEFTTDEVLSANTFKDIKDILAKKNGQSHRTTSSVKNRVSRGVNWFALSF